MFNSLKKKEKVVKENITPLNLDDFFSSLTTAVKARGQCATTDCTNTVLFRKLGSLVKQIESVSGTINAQTRPVLKELLEEVSSVCHKLSEAESVSDDIKAEMLAKGKEFDDMYVGLDSLSDEPIPSLTTEESSSSQLTEVPVSNVVDPEVLVAARMAEKDRQIELLMNTAQDLDMKNQDLEQRLIAANADASAVVNQARQSMTELRQELEASNRERERLTNVINSMTPTDFVDQRDDHTFNPD